ncbi:hypothetical protein D9757_007312 [Collybiopsis confluens]|uniref:UBX domain-containing protein n=1 Tax=Collybiopsis confluens TaxID=2823264 RepID=A0A8H5M6U4_9AGAR|nr:hypothetical protein D9757_007312 [Collybiopsis confluens]
MADLSSLNPSQVRAVEQLRDLTNGGDDEVAIGVLSSVDWDVERAAEMIFDGQQAAGGASSSNSDRNGSANSSRGSSARLEESYGRRYEEFDIDDSEQGFLRPRDQPRPSTSILSFITYPLHLLSSLFRFVFGILRIRIPYIPFLSLNFFRRSPGSTTVRGRPRAGGGIERWIRELEEETGALCAGSTASADATGIQVPEAGPSTLTSRATAASSALHSNSQKLLPPFHLGTYDSILRLCQSSFRIGCIILVSAEHDSTPEFKRATLTDTELVRILVDENVVCWGGDIRDKEPYEAGLKLGATTYPCVAFVGLQPSRNFTSSSNGSTTASQSTPALTVLSRHLGASACTPSALTTHLRDTLLPRVKPYLERTKAQKESLERERASERELREAQDRAFEETKRRDKERILRKMEEEKLELERKKAEEERRRVEEERREREREDAARLAEERERWRGWFRKVLPGEPAGASGSSQTIRIAVRMPDGRRLTRRFDARVDTLDVLYAYVDTELVVPSSSSNATTAEGEHSFNALKNILLSPSSKPEEWWGFILVSAYPRQPIPWEADTLLGGIHALAGGQLVVEMVSSTRLNGNGKGKGRTSQEAANGGDNDGYDTESSDEE